MKNFYIVTNRFKDPDGVNTRKIAHFLRSKGAECVCQIEQEEAFNKTGSYSDVRLVPDNTDCVIVLGGDGTLIQASRELSEKDIPFIGVNIGTLGYLTDTDMSSFEETLDSLLRDDYEIDRRMMLDGCIYRGEERISYRKIFFRSYNTTFFCLLIFLHIKRPDLVPEQNDYRQDSSQLNDNIKHIEEAFTGLLKRNQTLHQDQMSCAADGQPFCDTLYDTENDRL